MAKQHLTAGNSHLVKDVHDVSREIFEQVYSWFDQRDPLTVEERLAEVRVLYISTRASGLGERTFIDYRLHLSSCQMWIGSIQVAACHRLEGVGGQLVKAAEVTAISLGMKEVSLLPMPSTTEFWTKLDFAPHPRMAKVLWKTLPVN